MIPVRLMAYEFYILMQGADVIPVTLFKPNWSLDIGPECKSLHGYLLAGTRPQEPISR